MVDNQTTPSPPMVRNPTGKISAQAQMIEEKMRMVKAVSRVLPEDLLRYK